MTRRKPLPPDTRPGWRDEDMPVLMQVTGFAGTVLEPFPAEAVQQTMEILHSINPEPHFSHDPSYNWRRQRGPKIR